MASGLSPDQRRILSTILSVGATVGASPMELKAAVETGLVESNLSNPAGGDAGSAGWRQERGSLYPDPTNITNSAKRFFQETAALKGKYGTAGALAAAVQRPRADLRGKYQQVSSQADQLLGGGGAGGTAVSPGTTTVQTDPYSPDTTPMGTGLADLLASSMGRTQTQAPAPIADPSFSAAVRYGQGTIQPTGVTTAPAKLDTTAALQGLSSLQGPDANDVPVPTVTTTGQATDQPITEPGTVSDTVKTAMDRAGSIDAQRLPYKWGGGHSTNSKWGEPLDCSGAVSKVLGIDPQVSGDLMKYGQPGQGKSITIYANQEHVLMEINGHFFGTSKTNPGGGAGWIPKTAISQDYLKRFVARHPPGQ